MIIKDRDIKSSVKFLDIETGEVFKYGGIFYLKTSASEDEDNAFDLNRKTMTEFGVDTYVKEMTSELVLYGQGWKDK